MRTPGGENLYRRAATVTTTTWCAVPVDAPSGARPGGGDLGGRRSRPNTGTPTSATHWRSSVRAPPVRHDPGVKFYADRPATALRQLLTDLFVVVWVYAWIRVSMGCSTWSRSWPSPGRSSRAPATASPTIWPAPANRSVGCRPSVTTSPAPFNKAADAARGLASAGQRTAGGRAPVGAGSSWPGAGRAAQPGAVRLAAAAGALDAPRGCGGSRTPDGRRRRPAGAARPGQPAAGRAAANSTPTSPRSGAAATRQR